MNKLYNCRGKHGVQYYRLAGNLWEYWSNTLGCWMISSNRPEFYTQELYLIGNNYRQK